MLVFNKFFYVIMLIDKYIDKESYGRGYSYNGFGERFLETFRGVRNLD